MSTENFSFQSLMKKCYWFIDNNKLKGNYYIAHMDAIVWSFQQYKPHRIDAKFTQQTHNSDSTETWN